MLDRQNSIQIGVNDSWIL